MRAALSACDRCSGTIERGDLRCSLCGLAAHPPAVEERNGLTATWVRCTHCGAGVEYDAQLEAARCAFCASEVAVEKIENPPEQIQELLPFAITAEAAEDSLRRWLGKRGFFAPSDLSTEATVHSLRKLYWAAWLIEATGEISWTADSDADTGRAAWAPHAGQFDSTFRNVLVPASQGLSEAECERLGVHYELDAARPYAPGHHDGAVESFETDRAAARSLLLRVLEDMAREEVANDHIPGSKHRNMRVAVKLKGLHTRRLGLPAFVLAYRYRGELFRVIVHGQRPGIVFGTAPRSPWKIAAVILGVAAAIALAAWFALPHLR